MPYRILLICDHMWRDAPAAAIIRVELEKLIPNSTILIVDIHLLKVVVGRFHPHLVVMNHLHDPRRNEILDDVKRRGGLIVVNQPEGRANTYETMRWSTNDFTHELCDLYLCWGSGVTEYLPSDIRHEVTGCARWDFYYPPYNQLVQSREILLARYGLDATRPIVTVASSFPQGKFAKKQTDFLVKDWGNLKLSKVKGRENPVEHAHSELEAFHRFQSWLVSLRYEYPEYQILVKPHPAENIEMWTRFCDEIGASIMPMDYVFSLLALSDVHVARVECMTVPEAWIAGKPTVQCLLGNAENEGPGMDATKIGLPPVKTVGDFLGIVAEAIDAGGIRYGAGWHEEKQEQYLEKWLGPMPGSSERIAVAVYKLLEEKKPKAWKEPTHQDWVEIHGMLVQHSRDRAIPEPDFLGQFSKSPRYEDTQEWTNRARGIING